MDNKLTKKRRREQRAQQLFTACLLVNEMPGSRQAFFKRGVRDDYYSELVFDDEYKSRVGDFYRHVCVGVNKKGTPPGRKALKRFVRGYCSWLRKQVGANEDR